MPNNDLGTAHGRIRIDLDDRGSAAAVAALAQIQKEFELLNKRVSIAEKTLNKNTGSIDKNVASLKRANKDTVGWVRNLFGAQRIAKALDKDIVDLAQDMMRLNQQFTQTRTKYKPLENVYKVLDKYQQLKPEKPVKDLNIALKALNLTGLTKITQEVGKLDDAIAKASRLKRIKDLNTALNSVGFGLGSLGRKLFEIGYGRKSAMEAMPMWTKYAYGFSLSLGQLAKTALIAGAALNAGFITKFLNTNLFRKIVLQSTAAGVAIERLGNLSQKVFGRNLFGNLAVKLKDSENIISKWTKNTSHSLSGASRTFNAWFKPVAAAAKQIQMFSLGIGLMSAGIGDIISRFSFLGKIPKPLLVALGVVISTVLPAALQVFDKALIFTSNTLVGLLSGVKSLAGGFLALPGAIATVGIAAATLKTIFGGLKDKFQDVFSDDPIEAWAAIAALPEHLKPVGVALRKTVSNFKDMQVALQKLAFKGLEKQIDSLTEKYMPRLGKGMSQVAFSLRGAKDELVKFFEEGQTQKDFDTLFSNTAQTFGNLKNGLRPIADGFKDITVVGSKFIAELSTGFGGLTEKFAAWARINRENGNMMDWMRDSVQSAKDLINGTKDLGKGLWSILTMFRTNTGVNFLDSYAASMKKFQASVKMSRQGGILFDLSDSVKGLGMGKDKIETFKEVFKSFVDMMSGLAPAIQNISNAFSMVFVDSLEQAMNALKLFSKFMTMLNIDDFTGIVLGLVAGFKLLPTFIKPLWDSGRIIGGLIMTLMSAKKVIKAFDDGVVAVAATLEKIPGIGKKVGGSLINVATSARTLVGAFAMIAGPVAIAVTVLTALWGVMRAGSENAKAFDKQITQNGKNVVEWGKKLDKAFIADKGKIGRTVMDEVSMGMQTMLSDLEATADKAPGFIDHIADYFSNAQERAGSIPVEIPIVGTIAAMTRDSKELNRRQAEGDAAKLAAEKYRELTEQNVDLSMVMTGTQAAFDARIANIRNQGRAGEELAKVLERQRNEFNQVQAAMEALGPSGIRLAEGLREIADAGGDATKKLNGLKNVLTGLGFLKTDELEAAAEYTRTLGDLGDQIQQLKDDGADFSNVWNADGSLDLTKESAAKLVPVLKQVSDAYLDTASKGANVDEINNRLNAELEKVAPALGRNADQLKEYFKTSLGAAPIPVKIALAMEGVQDQIAKGIGNLLLQLNAQAEGTLKVPVALNFGSDESAHSFDKALEDYLGKDLFDQEGHIVKIKAGVQIDEASMQGFMKYLTDQGISLPNGPVADPAKIPVGVAPAPAPQIPPPTVANPQQAREQAPAIAPGLGPTQVFTPPAANFPAPVSQPQISPWELPSIPMPAAQTIPQPAVPQMGPVPDLTPKLAEASAKVDEVDGKMQKLVSGDRQIALNTDKLSEASTKIDEISSKFAEKKIEAKIEVTGEEKLNAISTSADTITNKVNNVFNTFKSQISEITTSIPQSFAAMTGAVSSEIEVLIGLASAAGSRFVDAFAAGMASNPSAINAARTLAEQVIAQYHQSPPKEGPLAKHGDAAVYAGKQFVSSYASGLTGALPTAADAAGSVAGAAGNALSGGKGAGAAAGQFLGQLLALTNFASSIVGVIQKVSETVLGAFKFISDPKGEGTFFGKRLYKKTVSDEELQKQRDDKLNQDYLSAVASGQRNNEQIDGAVKDAKASDKGTIDTSTPADTAKKEQQPQYGPPLTDKELLKAERPMLQWDEASQSYVQISDTKTNKTPETRINPDTKLPYTPEEIKRYEAANPLQVTLPDGMSVDDFNRVKNNPDQFSQLQSEDILKDLATSNADVADAMKMRDDPNSAINISEARVSQLLEGLDRILEANKATDTAASRMKGGAIEGLKSSVMGITGFSQAGNPIDTVASIVSQATSMASDVINAVVTGIETVGAVKGIADTLVRGVSSTEDIYKNIDNVQKIFELFAGIAGATASVTGLVGTIVGAAGAGDTSGGTQAAAMAINAIGMIAGFVQAGWEITNAVIDLGQEAYRIIGSYVGDFLGYLVGGAGGPLAGSVKFLLDEQANQLLTYSTDNPFDKRTFDTRSTKRDQPELDSRNQLIGNINVYGGPGSDPRDLTRQMMYQVNAAQYAGALAQ